MATATYFPIATQTLGSAASTITFSSIPSGYTDLRLVVSNALSASGYNFGVRLNGDSSTSYSISALYGAGTSVAITSQTNQPQLAPPNENGPGASYPSFYTVDVFNYASTSIYKTSLLQSLEEWNTSGNRVTINAGLYRSTSAITSLTIVLASGTYSAGTTATLWGI